MSSPERRDPELAALRASITELENVGNDYAAFLLMDTAVHVDLNRIIGGFTLPPQAAQAFAEHGAPAPTFVDSMNLDLTYEKGTGQFEILSGAVEFDNNFVIAYSHPRTFRGHDENLHRLDLFTYDKKGRLTMKPIGLAPNRDVQSFFSLCGVHIPVTPSGASWEDIVPPLLCSAEQGIITAQKITPLSPIHELVITEQTVESAVELPKDITSGQRPSWLSKAVEYDFSMDASDTRKKQVWDRLISLQLITYNPANNITATEAVLSSDTFTQPPSFKGIYRRSGSNSKEVTAHTQKTRHIMEATKLLQVEGELIAPTAELTQYITFLTAALRSTNPF